MCLFLWPCDLQVSILFRQNTSIKIVSNTSKYDAYYSCQNVPGIACCQIAAESFTIEKVPVKMHFAFNLHSLVCTRRQYPKSDDVNILVFINVKYITRVLIGQRELGSQITEHNTSHLGSFAKMDALDESQRVGE